MKVIIKNYLVLQVGGLGNRVVSRHLENPSITKKTKNYFGNSDGILRKRHTLRKMTMIIGTWNVQTITIKMEEIVQENKKIK